MGHQAGSLSATFFFVLSCLFKAVPAAHGSCQAADPIRDAAAALHHSHTRSELCLWPKPHHSNARSSTHWARPGIEPTTSWFLVGFISVALRQEFPWQYVLIKSKFYSELLISFKELEDKIWSAEGNWKKEVLWWTVSINIQLWSLIHSCVHRGCVSAWEITDMP